jgi:hypothetical protein
MQVSSVVEENNARCTGWICRLTQQAAHKDIRSARFIDYRRANVIESVAKNSEPFWQRAAAKVRTTFYNNASRFAAGMGVDDANCLHGGISGRRKKRWRKI